MKTIEFFFQKFLVLLLFFLFTFTVFSQTTTLKKISGKVTSFGKPLQNVNIIILGKKGGNTTNEQGLYTIRAQVGDKIQFSYVGYKKVILVVEDITKVLNINMDAYVNELDEVELTVNNKVGKVGDMQEIMDIDIKTSLGTINPLKTAGSVHYLNNTSLRHIASPSLEDALSGRFSKVQKIGDKLFIRGAPAKYDVDGLLYEIPPALSFSNIEHLFIIKGKALVIIRTKDAPEVIEARRKKTAAQYQNQNYYKNDAKTIATETSFSTDSKALLKEITGKITFLEEPLPFVNISIKNKDGGTKTDEKGLYTLQAEVGDILQYSHVSFKTITIIIEDITNVVNLEMIPKENKLDEIVVKGSKAGKALERAKKAQKKFSTARGKIDPKRAGYAVNFVEGDAVSSVYSSLSQALIGKVPGARIETTTGKFILKEATSINNVPDVLWEVDGAIYNREPELDLSQIKSVHVLKSLASTNRYGLLGAGGVVVVRTKSGAYDPNTARNNKTAQKYQNKKTYANDALIVQQQASNAYTQAIANFQNKNEAFSYYTNKLKTQLKDYAIHISIAQLFYSTYHDRKLSSQILMDLSAMYPKNPEILKTIAYQFQALDLKKEAVGIYQRIFKLRPHYAQSYRDLANAYRENDQYQKAWRIYMTYLLKGNDVSGEGIGQLLYNEMEWLYFNRKNQALIKERFVPKNKTIDDFRNDVRLVFEWNTSEAEFDLEFVNPDKRVYSFEHSLAKNQDLITDEKQKGYSSKEFTIANLDDGEWLINMTYQGNKKPEPTYLKVTQYYNWSKPNQTKKIAVFRFKNEREKIQLFKLDKQVLTTVNKL